MPKITQYRDRNGRGCTHMKGSVALTALFGFFFVFFASAVAQQPTKALPRIGFIFSTGTPETPSPLFESFRLGLNDLGYVDGKNVSIESRYAEGRLDRMPALVADLVQQKGPI